MTTTPMQQALARAHAAADDLFGAGNPINVDADGFTCDELGAIADTFSVDPIALRQALYGERGTCDDDDMPMVRTEIRSGRPCFRTTDDVGREWRAVWLNDDANGWRVSLGVQGTVAEQQQAFTDDRRAAYDGLPIWSERLTAHDHGEFVTVARQLLTQAVQQVQAVTA